MSKPLSCPLPSDGYDRIVIAHGGGGRLTHQLVENVFREAFDNPFLEEEHDGAILPAFSGRIAVTTDSHVVSPLFFPGGDIGALSVFGTVNDLAMCGARPRFLTAGFIIEEGLSIGLLRTIAKSMGTAAREVGVGIVAGDTKVVESGKGDGVFITTSGIGEALGEQWVGPSSVRSGDAVILSGDIGRHGMAVMAVREGLDWSPPIESDCASLVEIVLSLYADRIPVHCMRDLTRGGLATALVEIARCANIGITVEEDTIPVSGPVTSACELLGMDPLYVANEGRMVLILPEEEVDRALGILRTHTVAREAVRIGTVIDDLPRTVQSATGFGTRRSLGMLSGEQLPRIC